jgi:DTW domain-containing protein YfiP
MLHSDVATDDAAGCPRCGKPKDLCVCDGIVPLATRVALVILQHPQEQDRELGTARLAALHFTNATVKIGLSWPSLSKLLGRQVDPKRWAILYLGSFRAAAVATHGDLITVNRKGEPLADSEAALRDVEGIIVIDGTWSQAKALWWRNGWMLKCQRVVLAPKRPSRYGRLRKEPRREGLSTLEAAAMLVARLEHRPEIETALLRSFERLLARYRTRHGATHDRRP